MCLSTGHSEPLVYGKKHRLADFFDRWWDEYVKSPKEFISPEQFKAVNAIRVCRTAALGVDVYACPDCGELTEVYHSCKNRFCPTCSWEDTVKWADKVKERMMCIPHRHVVMTLPHQLHGLIKANGKRLLNVLMRVSADTFKDWLSHKHKVKPGIISVLHTFGETKDYHVHVHMIVSWGGVHAVSGETRAVDNDFVNYGFLQKKFRCKFEDELVRMYDSDELEHGFVDRFDLLRFLKKTNRKAWVLHLEPSMDVPAKVVRYIGRYSKRACLSEYKITKMEGESISFRYKDYRTLDGNKKPMEKELELHYSDFFPRLLQHVPLRYFRIVRYYGTYATKSRKPEVPDIDAEEDVAEETPQLTEREEGALPIICRHCQKEKEYRYTVLKSRITGETKVFARSLFAESDQEAA